MLGDMSRVRMLSSGVRPRTHAGLVLALSYIAQPFKYRGVQRLSWEFSRFFSHDDAVTVQISDDTRLIVQLDDGYWTSLLNRNYTYEAEIAALLHRMLTPDTYFLDCGANIGYWTMLCRNRARAVAAVEASPTTYRHLEANAKLNNADVSLIHAALWHTDGETLTILEHAQQHAGATVRGDNAHAKEDGWHPANVTSITLRSLIEEHCPDPSAPIIIKLDVEGAEIPAIEGAGDTLRKRNVIVVYEDHGSDPRCEVTRHLQRLGMVTADLVTGMRLTVEEIADQKIQKWRGYNYLAYYPEAIERWPSNEAPARAL